jgi:hypothetical protein
MLKYLNVEVGRSETTVFHEVIAPWELPVLAAVNGEDVTKVVGSTEVRRPLPDPGFEYDRMATKYGTDKEGGGQEFVALVYGLGAIGVERIAAEIRKHLPAAAPAPAASVDPLDGLFDDISETANEAEAISE